MNQVPLPTLILRVRRYCNIEGATAFITDAEICDNLSGSLATEFHDFVRQAVGDQYFRKSFTFPTSASQGDPSTYDLPADFLDVISVDCYLGLTTGPTQGRINARRYMEEERNVYSFLPLGWYPGAWILYSLLGPNQIRFQPVPPPAFAVQVNYQPKAESLGLDSTKTATLFDDINGWSEPAVCDAARKCAVKMNRLDLATYLGAERDRVKQQLRTVIAMRHASEPERPHFYGRQHGDGWSGGWS